MSRGAFSIVLLLLALIVHLGLTRPAREAGQEARAEASRLEREARLLRARVGAQEQARSLLAGLARTGEPRQAAGDAPARLRLALIESLRGQPVSGVRLAVSPASPPRFADCRVQAEGSFTDLVRLSGHLVRPGAGLILEKVTLGSSPRGLTLEVSGSSFTAGAAP